VDAELFEGEFTYLTILNNPHNESHLSAGRWQTHANAIEVDGPQTIKASLEGYSATLSTALPFLYLPAEIATELRTLLGFRHWWMDLPYIIDCKQRDLLPNILLRV
jgi:hypothetical protein